MTLRKFGEKIAEIAKGEHHQVRQSYDPIEGDRYEAYIAKREPAIIKGKSPQHVLEQIKLQNKYGA